MKVRELLSDELLPGHYRLDWNGRNDAGKVVSSGVCFYRIEAGAFSGTKWIAWIASLAFALVFIVWQAVRIVNRDRKVLLANRELQQKTADLESANQALQTTQSQLVQAEKMSTLRLLAGGVAHELNNPPQTLLAGVRRILRYPDDVERHRQSADLMEQAARHSSTIVQNLLSYTRKPSPEMARVDLNEAVASTISGRMPSKWSWTGWTCPRSTAISTSCAQW